MNTPENSANKETNGGKLNFTGKEEAADKQFEIVNEFFRANGSSEMIGSVHRMVEEFLFTKNLARVTPEMRVHIVNNLRIATLVAQLGECAANLRQG